MSGSDKTVQPSAAFGDPPSRVRRLVRCKEVRWGKLIADHLSLAVPIGEIAAGARLTAKRIGPQMAPQRLENIDSAPGNGMAPDASNLQHLVSGRGGAFLPNGRAARIRRRDQPFGREEGARKKFLGRDRA